MTFFDDMIRKISKDHQKKIVEFTNRSDREKYMKTYKNSYLFLITNILKLYSKEMKIYNDLMPPNDAINSIIDTIVYHIKRYIDDKYILIKSNNSNNSHCAGSRTTVNNIIKQLYKYSKNDLIEFIAIILVDRLPSTCNNIKRFVVLDKNSKYKWNNNDNLCKFIKKSITSGDGEAFGELSIDLILYNYINKLQKNCN
jgi:hypothetical protein